MKGKLERRVYEAENLEIREEENKPKKIVGYAAVFDKLSVPLWGFREKITKGAFKKSVEGNKVKALWNHNSDYPLANQKRGTLFLEEDEKGLRFEMELPDNSWGRDAEVSIKRGDTDGVSFAFQTIKDEWDKSDEKNIIRTLIEAELHEISPTPFPAYPQTKVAVRTAEEVYNEFLAAEVQADEAAREEQRKVSQAAELRKRKLKLIELEVN